MLMNSGVRRAFVGTWTALILGATGAAAYEPGEIAYLCDKNQKFMWVVGKDSWTACPVRILSRAGNSHRILAHERSCYTRFLSVSRGQEAWAEGYALWPSRSACEDQGKPAPKPKPKVTAKAPPPPAPVRVPEVSLATNVPVLENLRKNKAIFEKEKNPFGLVGVSMAEAIAKANIDAITVENNCKTEIKVAVDMTDKSGKLVQRRWTLGADTKSSSVLKDGKTSVLPAGNAILLHASTAAGKQIYAGNAKTVKYGAETVHLKEFRISARPYHIKFCP